jgi:hypothetical protein
MSKFQSVKIPEPEAPMPPVYENIVLEEKNKEENNPPINVAEKPVPDKTLNAFGAYLKFDKNTRKSIIQDNETLHFVCKLQIVLDQFDKNSIQYDQNVLLFVMTACENFILHKKSGEFRKQLVIDVARKYLYDGNIDLLSKRVEELFPLIKNHKFFSRNWRKVVRWFLNLFTTR